MTIYAPGYMALIERGKHEPRTVVRRPRSDRVRYGQGLPPAGGWKLHMTDDEYSPEHQDEYRRLWHEAAARRDLFADALKRIAHYPFAVMSDDQSDLRAVKDIATAALSEAANSHPEPK
jgi:hypothetical protein